MKNEILLTKCAEWLDPRHFSVLNIPAIKSVIERFVAENIPHIPVIKELHVMDLTEKNPRHDSIQYVYMDDANKVAVGMNSHVMYVNPDEYRELKVKNGEQSLMDMYGNIAHSDDKFPDYHQWAIADDKLIDVALPDGRTFTQNAMLALSVAKLKGEKKAYVSIIPGKKFMVDVEYVPLFIVMGTDNWKVTDDGTRYIKKDGEKFLLISGSIQNN